MVTTKIREDANKFSYLAKCYPEKDVNGVIKLFQSPPIDVNCAIWFALESDWLKVIERKEKVDKLDDKGEKTGTQKVTVSYFKTLNTPEVWHFGNTVDELEEAITYAFEKLNAEEKDLEENYLTNILSSYLAHDALIAVKHLLEKNVLHEYQIEDGDNAYIFYTLKKNAGKNWGQKQFKQNPLTGKSNDRASKK